MDTQKIEKVGYRIALIALTAAISCLVIYTIACVISPVSWSPDSSKIALLVTPMGEDPDLYALFTYDISTGRRILLDKVGKNGVLSGPAWSPDGKWITYYKVDPSFQDDSNTATEKVTGEELFSEKNKMLPSFLPGIAKKEFEKEIKDRSTFDVKLMLVKPDGRKKKVLRVLKFVGDEDARKGLPSIQPAWSTDSKSVFYVRVTNGVHYIASLDIQSDQTYIHMFSTSGVPLISPDGKWLASWFEGTLILVRVDGTFTKYIEIPSEYMLTAWSPDSKRLLLIEENAFLLIDADTGDKQFIRDSDTRPVGHAHFSSDGDMIYYIAGYKNEASNSSEDKYSIRSMNIHDKSITVLFKIPKEISLNFENDMPTQFSISPNGRMFLVRGLVTDGEDREVLLFWDKKHKIVETAPWLLNIIFDGPPVFEQKLIGKWKGKDGATLTCERTRGNTYKLTLLEPNDEKQIYTANLYKQNNMIFLYVRSEKRSEVVYLKVDQIEPILLVREEMNYNEVVEMLSKPPELLKQETTPTEYAFEGTRIK